MTQVHAHGRTTTPHPTQTNQTPTETVEPEGTVNTSDHTTTDCPGVILPVGDVNPMYPTLLQWLAHCMLPIQEIREK